MSHCVSHFRRNPAGYDSFNNMLHRYARNVLTGNVFLPSHDLYAVLGTFDSNALHYWGILTACKPGSLSRASIIDELIVTASYGTLFYMYYIIVLNDILNDTCMTSDLANLMWKYLFSSNVCFNFSLVKD